MKSKTFLPAAVMAMVVGVGGAGSLWAGGDTTLNMSSPLPVSSPQSGIFSNPVSLPSPTPSFYPPIVPDEMVAPDDANVGDMSYECDPDAGTCGDGSDAIYGGLVPAPPNALLAQINPNRNLTIELNLVKPVNLPAGNNFKLQGVTVTAIAYQVDKLGQLVAPQILTGTSDATGEVLMTFSAPKLRGIYVVITVDGKVPANRFTVGPFVTGGVTGKAVSKRSTGRSDFTFTPKINLKAVK